MCTYTYTDMCTHMYIYTYSSQYRDAGRSKEIKGMGEQGIPWAKEIFMCAILGTRAICSSALV